MVLHGCDKFCYTVRCVPGVLSTSFVPTVTLIKLWQSENHLLLHVSAKLSLIQDHDILSSSFHRRRPTRPKISLTKNVPGFRMDRCRATSAEPRRVIVHSRGVQHVRATSPSPECCVKCAPQCRCHCMMQGLLVSRRISDGNAEPMMEQNSDNK